MELFTEILSWHAKHHVRDFVLECVNNTGFEWLEKESFPYKGGWWHQRLLQLWVFSNLQWQFFSLVASLSSFAYSSCLFVQVKCKEGGLAFVSAEGLVYGCWWVLCHEGWQFFLHCLALCWSLLVLLLMLILLLVCVLEFEVKTAKNMWWH